MTKTMIVGDTHADATFTANVLKHARNLGVQVVVQVGDFGYTFDKNQLASISAWLDADKTRAFFWLDGNHDQHDYIEETIIGDKSWDFPIAHFHEHMYYCPRGSTTTIGSTPCVFLGGAYSIDKHHRHEGLSWWKQELIRSHDMRRAVMNADVNGAEVMFCHDAPPSEFLEAWLDENGYKVGPESKMNRVNLGKVVDSIKPSRLFHGHYHRRYSADYTTPQGWTVGVEGIGANVNKRGYIDPTAWPDENYVIEHF